MAAFASVLRLSSSSAATAGSGAIADLAHDSWSLRDGLPQVSVQALAQTREGYLWVGTQEGLARFDGDRFVVFDKRNTTALVRHRIECLTVASDGSLWIGTHGGGTARLQGRDFQAIQVSDLLSGAIVHAIRETRDGSFWIATDTGLVRVRARSAELERVQGLPSERIRCLAEDAEGHLWVGTAGAGVAIVNAADAQVVERPERMRSGTVLSILATAERDVLVGIEGEGLLRARAGRVTKVVGLPDVDVECLLQTRDGAVWAGTRRAGVCRLHADRVEAFSVADGLTHERVISLLEDREGSLWIGTFGGGLNRLRSAPFATIGPRRGLPHTHVRSICEARDGGMLVGTEKGLAVVRGGRAAPAPGEGRLARETVLSVVEDRGGRIWAGTDGAGLAILSRSGPRFLTSADGLGSDVVSALATDPADGTVWAGTAAGLSHFVNGGLRTWTTAEGLPHPQVGVLLFGRDGTLWIGTRGGGLARLDRSGLAPVDLPLSPGQRIVKAIHESDDGTLWLATADGLVRYRRGEVRPFGRADGLLEDNLHWILEDERHDFWISSNRGVLRVSRADLDACAAGSIAQVPNRLFGLADGMAAAECNGGSQPAGWRDRSGHLWFPTVNGAVVIDPRATRPAEPPPAVGIEEVLADDRPLDPSTPATLPPGTNRLEVRYTAFTLVDASNVHFRFELEGLDRDWVPGGRSRSVLYSHLPPGRYVFRVAASNREGIWDGAGTSYALTVPPRLYERKGFVPAVVLLAAILAGAVVRLRTAATRRRARELENVVEQRTRELRALARELEEQSLQDPLTRLGNRRLLFATLSPLLEDARRRRDGAEGQRDLRRGPQSVPRFGFVLLDIDDFKAINDTHGHDAGDEVLRGIAAMLRERVRAADLAVRWGGEEFLLVLAEVPPGELPALGERIRQSVADRPFRVPSGEIVRITCSIGMIAFPFYADARRELTLEQLIGVTDRAMYRAKSEGKNRVVLVLPGERAPERPEDFAELLGSLEEAEARGLLRVGPPPAP